MSALATLIARPAPAGPAAPERFDGFNVITVPGRGFGSMEAVISLANAKALGANAIAVVPFLWQPAPSSPHLGRGSDMTDEELRAGIREAHMVGLSVVLKPHVWVPQSWAGAVAMKSEDDWRTWFANYRRELTRLAAIGEEEKVEALAIGTELALTSAQPAWNDLIDAARGAYHGPLVYFAHNVEEAEAVPFWDRLERVGVTLYPPLGADYDRAGRLATMRATAESLDALAQRTGKPIIVGEIGLRSAVGAAAKPWESAEERAAAPDPRLQADILGDWLVALDRPAISGVLIWRWFSNPDAGGPTDTDFTVQGKPAERVLECAWTHRCIGDQATARAP